MEDVTGNDMSSSGPEDRKTPGAAPLLGDLNLESLGELGTSVILIRNLATELVNAVEQMRSAGTSVWNALNLLRYPASDAPAGSSGPLGSVGGLLGGQAAGRGAFDDLLNPLDAVGRAAHFRAGHRQQRVLAGRGLLPVRRCPDGRVGRNGLRWVRRDEPRP